MEIKEINKLHEKQDSHSFLKLDFTNCSDQLRHYDAQIIDILKISFSIYSAVAGVIFGIYKLGKNPNPQFLPFAIVSLFIGLLIGMLMISMAITNRAYFVRTARYINECRAFYINYNQIEFSNKSKMYMDYKKPLYFNWHSSQSFVIYTLAAFNSLCFSCLIYVFSSSITSCKFLFPILGFLILLSTQLLLGIRYLRNQEKIN